MPAGNIPQRERRQALTFLVAHGADLRVLDIYTSKKRVKPKKRILHQRAGSKEIKLPPKEEKQLAKRQEKTKADVVRQSKLAAAKKTAAKKTKSDVKVKQQSPSAESKAVAHKKSEPKPPKKIAASSSQVQPPATPAPVAVAMIYSVLGRPLEYFYDNTAPLTIATLRREILQRKWGFPLAKQKSLIRASDGHDMLLDDPATPFFPGATGIYVLTE